MMHECAEPYSSLKPFQALFATGAPILMYHKLGPRPPGVRLKGLYVSRKLFGRQLRELRTAGYVSACLSDLSDGRPGHRVGITFDDGCCNVLQHGLEPLAENRMQAIQFLVAGKLGQQNDWDVASGEIPERLMDRDQVRLWLSAGHQIGSHTLTHPWLTRLSRPEAREQIVASKKTLEDLFGLPVRHFCYPYGDWNAAVRDLVAEAGYETACTTQAGVNTPGTDRFALKRFTARYPSRNLKALWRRWRMKSAG